VKRLVGAFAVLLALTGCTTSTDDAAPTVAPTTSAAPTDPDLVPVVPVDLDTDSAETETTRIADAIQGLIDPSDIVNVDDHSQVVDKTTDVAGYYGVIRTITLESSADPVLLAQTIVGVMESSTWLERESTNDAGLYLTALASSTDAASSWFLLVGGDSTVEGQSVLTLQLASPDLP